MTTTPAQTSETSDLIAAYKGKYPEWADLLSYVFRLETQLTASQSSLAAERREREKAEKSLVWQRALRASAERQVESAEARIAELEDRINGGWVDAALPAKD